jgi:glutaryl-CoA dehydrogenase (non-decarboxylating)
VDFSLSPEHQMAQKMVRDFAQKEIAPVIKEYDRKQEPIPFALKRMGELGILGLCFPVRYGGQGMDYITLGLACEELEVVDTSLRVAMSVHTGLCSLNLFQWGTEEQKQKFLVPLAKGEKIGCGAFTEPGMGSDVAAMTTSAKRDGDHYILNGEKMWISLASKADLAIVTVKANPAARKPSDGLSVFIVDLHSPGVKTGDIHGKLGVRAGSTGWISFTDVTPWHRARRASFAPVSKRAFPTPKLAKPSANRLPSTNSFKRRSRRCRRITRSRDCFTCKPVG